MTASDVRPLLVPGAWIFTPKRFPDDRGFFFESFSAAAFAEAVGQPMAIAQTNVSVNRRGTLRGLHFSDVPPSQAKYVTCHLGAVIDVVVDIRVGSPTFGKIDHVLLDDVDRRAIYIAEGLGHAFFALTENATVNYLCSTGYAPGREHGTHPLDPSINWPWPADIEPIVSAKDRQAPSLDDAESQGLLPKWNDCVKFYESLRS